MCAHVWPCCSTRTQGRFLKRIMHFYYMTIYGQTLTKEPAKGHEIKKFRQRLAYHYHVLNTHGHNLAQKPLPRGSWNLQFWQKCPCLLLLCTYFFPNMLKGLLFILILKWSRCSFSFIWIADLGLCKCRKNKRCSPRTDEWQFGEKFIIYWYGLYNTQTHLDK